MAKENKDKAAPAPKPIVGAAADISTSRKRFKVSPGGVVMHPKGGRYIYPGEELPGGLSEKVIKSLQASRHIVEIQNEPQVGAVRDGLVEVAPGTSPQPRIGLTKKDDGAPVSDTLTTEVHNGPAPTNLPQPGTSDASLWVIRPELLKGKDVSELNAMIHERDPSVPPFETAEEAAAHLSQDYRPKD